MELKSGTNVIVFVARGWFATMCQAELMESESDNHHEKLSSAEMPSAAFYATILEPQDRGVWVTPYTKNEYHPFYGGEVFIPWQFVVGIATHDKFNDFKSKQFGLHVAP